MSLTPRSLPFGQNEGSDGNLIYAAACNLNTNTQCVDGWCQAQGYDYYVPVFDFPGVADYSCFIWHYGQDSSLG